MEVKSKSSIKKERAATSPRIGNRKRKFPSPTPGEACWVCGERRHYKDECPYVRCRYYKKLRYIITECPAIPEQFRRSKPTREQRTEGVTTTK